ncbi:MAG: exodeoxyribonuclease VII large subunit [Burkholderiaceae bacterium]
MNTGSPGLGQDSESRSSTPQILSIGDLNRQVAALLGRQFPLLWVKGEISNFTRAASGHCYFSLKDNRAQARAVLFRSRARAVPFDLRNGLQVEAQVAVGLYEPRGDFQLNVERVRAAGAGDLHQQFIALRDKLQREGLFDDSIKRPVNPLPHALAVVTSLQAAALRDVLITLARRAAHVPVVVCPTPVQGVDAPSGIIAALAAAAAVNVSTILLVRGGGALEDLWSFNDEGVARAIRASPVPVVTGVGHESDVTIADFAADLRAATPTAAATLSTTERDQLVTDTEVLANALRRGMRQQLDTRAQRVDILARLLPTPMDNWFKWRARLDQASNGLRSAHRQHQARLEARFQRASARLVKPTVSAGRAQVDSLARELRVSMQTRLAADRARLDALASQLELVDPGQVVKRGFAVVRNAEGALVTSIEQAIPQADWTVSLADGDVTTQVVATTPRKPTQT